MDLLGVTTVELWTSPDESARYVANGTLSDAGELQFSLANNVLPLAVGALPVKYDLAETGP